MVKEAFHKFEVLSKSVKNIAETVRAYPGASKRSKYEVADIFKLYGEE